MRPKQLLFEIMPYFYYGQNYIDDFKFMKSVHERLYSDSDISLVGEPVSYYDYFSDFRISIKFKQLFNN